MDSMNKHKDWMYVVFRVLVGLVFFMHGAQKMFGWFGGGKKRVDKPLSAFERFVLANA